MSERMSPPATPYQLIGGEAGVRRLANAFYDVLDREPKFAPLRAVHAPDLTSMRARLAAWMSVWMGGPGPQPPAARPCILQAHAGLAIDAAGARLWISCMRRAYREADAPGALVGMIDAPLAAICEGLRSDYGSAEPLAFEHQA